MFYTAEHIDAEKFEEGLRDHREFQMQQKRLAIEKASSFFDGYEKCILDVSDMFHCTNYESSAKRTAAYRRGAHEALLALCNTLGITAPDAGENKDSAELEVAAVATRIREAAQGGILSINPEAFSGCENLQPIQNPATQDEGAGEAPA